MTLRQPNLLDALPPPPRPGPDLARARHLLHGWLADARAAATMPWTEQRTGTLEILVSQVSRVLPGEERDAVCAAFAAELARLRAAGPYGDRSM